MHISKQEIEAVANLARLELSAEETRRMTEQLDTILDYMSRLREVDTSGVEPMSAAPVDKAVFRDDVIRPSLERDQALANAPDANGEAFVVPRII